MWYIVLAFTERRFSMLWVSDTRFTLLCKTRSHKNPQERKRGDRALRGSRTLPLGGGVQPVCLSSHQSSIINHQSSIIIAKGVGLTSSEAFLFFKKFCKNWDLYTDTDTELHGLSPKEARRIWDTAYSYCKLNLVFALFMSLTPWTEWWWWHGVTLIEQVTTIDDHHRFINRKKLL